MIEMKTSSIVMIVLAAGVLGGVWVTQAQAVPPVVIDTVTVGNPGNAGDPFNSRVCSAPWATCTPSASTK
jgi:hypothetical protein